MFIYEFNDDLIISMTPYPDGRLIPEEAAGASARRILFLNQNLSRNERIAFRVSHSSQLGIHIEDETMIWQNPAPDLWPDWLLSAIQAGRVISVNTAHPDWEDGINHFERKTWRIHVAGLGDVGGTLLTGLRLLGHGDIRELGLYDPDPAKCQRWYREIGQICTPFEADDMIVTIVEQEELFDCDMFVFCASRSVPPLDQKVTDVRMVQFEGNSGILKPYAQRAVQEGFTGIFAVVSDPVDQLCQFVQKIMTETAANEKLIPLKADQIRGYGLGVMNGRASWYSRQNPEFKEYLTEGRAYGPHGNGLIIADSIENYDDEKSDRLTELTLNANFELRSAGFKPYVAPALSSGAISLLCTIRGQWHYSAVSLGGLFMGCKNRLINCIQETECPDMPERLKDRLRATCAILRETL